jgi:hypothetical protein
MQAMKKKDNRESTRNLENGQVLFVRNLGGSEKAIANAGDEEEGQPRMDANRREI